MAILALMALALARPTLYSQVPLGDNSVPTALGLVFDTSLSMKYKDKDKTRLDEAKERAREIVGKLPDSSLVFVVDSSISGSTGLSPAAALKRIDELTISHDQPAAQRGDGRGVRGRSAERQAGAGRVCPDRPGQVGVGHRPSRPRAWTRSRRSRRPRAAAWSPSSCSSGPPRSRTCSSRRPSPRARRPPRASRSISAPGFARSRPGTRRSSGRSSSTSTDRRRIRRSSRSRPAAWMSSSRPRRPSRRASCTAARSS